MTINLDASHLGKRCKNFLHNSWIQMVCGHKIQGTHECSFLVLWVCACCASILQCCTSSSPKMHAWLPNKDPKSLLNEVQPKLLSGFVAVLQC